MDIPETLNLDYIDQQYQIWKKEPESLSRDWRFFLKDLK